MTTIILSAIIILLIGYAVYLKAEIKELRLNIANLEDWDYEFEDYITKEYPQTRYTVLPELAWEAIFERLDKWYNTQKELAEEFNVAQSTISNHYKKYKLNKNNEKDS